MVKPILNFIFGVLLFCSCNQEQKTEAVNTSIAQSMPTTEAAPLYSSQVFVCDSTNPTLGFGYNIITDGHIFIHQPSVPSIPGNKGFSSKQQAETTAQFIIYKLTHNVMPPSVTPRELDSLGVLNK